ncbi:hypothetical protein [uncultured Cohaesibacter sp.]|uniref:hypothetical protein n=1 Tax=uncultured Cohaesibacter sp. TaxID=1002546 RepID=UPI00292EAE55|nr:hypothetical protein [uncultured Cohaesibacter sp.]
MGDINTKLQQFEKVKELINGPEAELFKTRYLARYFSGNITFIMGDAPFTLNFHKGEMVSVELGKPINGIHIGLGGSDEQWTDFFRHKNFQLATSPKHNPLCFEILGSPLAYRQNNNTMAQLMRVMAKVMQ